MKRLVIMIISAAINLATSAASVPVKLYNQSTGEEYTAISCAYDSSTQSLTFKSSFSLGGMSFRVKNIDTGEMKNEEVRDSGGMDLNVTLTGDSGNVEIKIVSAEGTELCSGQFIILPSTSYTYDSAGNRVSQKKYSL